MRAMVRQKLMSRRPSGTPDYFLDSTNGAASDSKGGMSPGMPFATLAAIEGAFKPGTVIGIKRGSTYSGSLDITAKGAAGLPVTFVAYGPPAAAKPLITATADYCITMTDSAWIVIDGLAGTAADWAGVKTDDTCSNFVVRNCEMYDCGFGMELHGSNAKIFYNYIHDGKMIVDTIGGDDDVGAQGFSIWYMNNVELAYNRVLRCEAHSYDYTLDGGGFETWRACNGVHIHDNWVEDSNGFFEAGGIFGDTASNILIERNVSLNNGVFHHLNNGDGTTYGIAYSGVEFRYNTILNNDGASYTPYSMDTAPGSWYTNHHNISSSTGGGQHFYVSPVANRSYNCYWGPMWVIGATNSLLTGEVKDDPLFVSSTDLHLQGGSPAAGMGAYA
jgi:hypothetical protein